MIIGGRWVGLGLGDSSAEIRKIKAFMRRKFISYAGHLADTELYDQQMVTAVMEMQTRYGVPANGIIGYSTKITMGYLLLPPTPKPTLFTVHGTAVSMWDGPPADTARAVLDRYVWQPIGNYPAAAFPMAPSVAQGRAELNAQIDLHPGPFALAAYSQGAIVVSQVYKYDLLPVGGRLHHRLGDLHKTVTWGNPMREVGRAWPDPNGQLPTVTSHGIADDLLTDTPDWWRDYAHRGDLYTDVEGQAGENKTAIYKVVMGERVFSGPDSLLAQVLEVVTAPLFETIAIFRAVMDAGLFFASGTGPHLNYAIGPAIDYLRAPP